MKSDNKQCKQPNNIDIFSCTQETIHLYNQFMEDSYAKTIQFKNLQADLAKFFDGLIWAEKKNPLLVYQMFEMKALNQIVAKYVNTFPIVILKNSILLLGNCESLGLVAQQILQHAYPHYLITSIFKPEIFNSYQQQIEEYIGNFLKCYHKLFKIQWLEKFILPGGYFQLLEINLKFFNCLELITRTGALNIVLDLLHYKQVRNFIANCEERRDFYRNIFDLMTKLFKNQLAEFGLRIVHISTNDNCDLILEELEDKIALWEDISKNCEGIQNIFQLYFSKNVIFPLTLGPLRSKQIPFFTLKFSLLVLRKLIPVMKNFGILQVLIRLVFVQQSIYYDPNSLSKALIPPFSLKKLASTNILLDQQEQQRQLYTIDIKKFYQNLFISKDNHFILMANSLLSTLFKQAQDNPQLMKQYGLQYGGKLYMKVGKTLMLQIRDTHRLHTIQSILNTLITIGCGKCLQTQLQNQYIYFFQKLIKELKTNIKSSKECVAYLAQVVEYDINIIEEIKFAQSSNTSKYQNLFKVVFVWDVSKEQTHDQQFYSWVPESPQEYLRYQYAKFMMLRKARAVLLEGYAEDSLLIHFYSMIITQSPFISGDIYHTHEFKNNSSKCQLIEHKTSTPALYIKDQDFFVLAKPISEETLQILEGVKAKHLGIEENKKKELKISIRQFNKQKRDIVQCLQLKIKGSQEVYESIRNTKKVVFNKHFLFIKESLQKTQTKLPPLNLI